MYYLRLVRDSLWVAMAAAVIGAAWLYLDPPAWVDERPSAGEVQEEADE